MRINFYKLYITKSYGENFFEICVYYNKRTKSISLLYLRIIESLSGGWIDKDLVLMMKLIKWFIKVVDEYHSCDYKTIRVL